MTPSFRRAFLLLSSVLVALGPDVARAQTPARSESFDALPAGAVLAIESMNALAALGLDGMNLEAAAGVIPMLFRDELGADAPLVTSVVAAGLHTLRQNIQVGVYASPNSDGQLRFVILVTTPNSDAVQKLAAALDRSAGQVSDMEIAGAKFHTPHVGAPAWGVSGDRFLLVAGDGNIDARSAVLTRLGDAADALGRSPAYKAARGEIPTPNADDARLVLFADLKAGFAAAIRAAGEHPDVAPMIERAVDATRLKGLRSLFWQSWQPAGVALGAGLLRYEGERRGVLKLWDQQPLTRDDLALLPASAHWGTMTNLDLAAFWQEMLRVIEQFDPDAAAQVQAAADMSRAFVGFSITDDFLPAFGDTWVLFDAPAHGGMLGLGAVLVADAVDESKINAAMLRLVELIAPFAAQAGVTLKHAESTIAGRSVHHVAILGVPCPVAPAWGFQQGRFVFGLLPQTVAAAMEGIDPKTGGPRLVDDPAVKQTLAGWPQTIHAFGVSDVHYFSQQSYPIFTYAAAALANLSPKDAAGLARLPHLSGVLKGERYALGVTSLTPTGAHYLSRGSSPSTLFSAPTFAVAGVVLAILMPSVQRGRELSRRAVSAVNLRNIGVACMTYAAAHDDQLPPSLDALIEGGYLPREALNSPTADDVHEVSYVLVDGLSFRAVARADQTVLAYEKPHSPEGTHVLFLDGAVRFVPMSELRTLMRATFEPLKREVPAELRD